MSVSKAVWEFDGVAYSDADASDPNRLGWMQGSPPSIAQRIRFQDDDFFKFPQLRWSLSHIRELVHKACPDVEEAIKWSMPFFMVRGVILGHVRRSVMCS